jgi:hypothetical protein
MSHRSSTDTKRAPTEAAMLSLEEALPLLAGVLVAHGEDAGAPVGRISPRAAALTKLEPLEAAEQAIALVHAVFQRCRPSGALTAAAKRVGNAALRVKRAVALEAAGRQRIALREARPAASRPASRRRAA